MSDHDTFFTLSIVGPVQQVLMGRRMRPSEVPTEGLRIALSSHDSTLTRLWRERVLLAGAQDRLGQPQPTAGALRRWLERHALWLACSGLLAWSATAVFWGWQWSR